MFHGFSKWPGSAFWYRASASSGPRYRREPVVEKTFLRAPLANKALVDRQQRTTALPPPFGQQQGWPLAWLGSGWHPERRVAVERRVRLSVGIRTDGRPSG